MNRTFVLPLLALSLLAAPALAQEKPIAAQGGPSAQPASVGAAPSAADDRPADTSSAAAPPAVLLSADDSGFQFKSADGGFLLRLRGEVQSDGRFFVDDAAELGTNTFFLRRARIALGGTLYRSFDYLIRTDFGNAQPGITDAYVDARFTKAFQVQAGKFKAPVGLERVQSAADRPLLELGFPTALVPKRDLGVAAHGELFGARLEYAAGVFNGVLDGSSEDFDSYDSKDVVGRLFAHPFRSREGSLLQNLGLGVAGSTGTQYGRAPAAGTASVPNLPSFRTSARQTFFRYRTGADAAATVIADGQRSRLVPQAYFYAGPVGLQGEYAVVRQRVARGADAARLTHTAGQVTANVVLTGEQATFKRLKPAKPFDSARGQWGAFELVGRLQTLQLDEATFPTFASPGSTAGAGSAQSALGIGGGLNWYLNANVRIGVNYERTTFKAAPGGTAPVAENLLLSRFQIAF